MSLSAEGYYVRLTVTSQLPEDLGYIPMSPVIDFSALIEGAGIPGVFDPNTIQVVNVHTDEVIEHARTEDFAYSDKGRLEWVIEDPSHTEYEIRFSTAEARPLLQPQEHVPMIGTGDLLRYNAGIPRPITMPYSMKLIDLTGDGKADLVGCWNYSYRPGDPISGLICYPRVGPDEAFTFGDRTRIRYVETADSRDFRHFPGTYIEADFADFTGNGLVDIVYAAANSDRVTFFRNIGERDHGGFPIFVRDLSIPAPVEQGGGLHAVDLDGDGIFDLVVNGHYIRNTNPSGWPFEPGRSMDLGIEQKAAFIDLDGDGRLDVIESRRGDRGGVLSWRRNMGDGLTFGPPMPLPGIEADACNRVSAVMDGARRGILIQHDVFQNISFYERIGYSDGQPLFHPRGRAQSISAVMTFSDQGWPCVCDWNNDGKLDLLIGGGYGWPRIAINEGHIGRPAFREPELIYAEGEPIRILRDEVLYSRHWHNMGYPYPAFVDWDGDGLRDLMLPNETNRIIWYRNIGTPEGPAFGPRQYLEVDGFPDSPERRAASGRLGEDRDLTNHPYPYDDHSPFFWRTGAAFADWNGDGLMDFITHDNTRKATLFVQYRDRGGTLRLRKQGPVRLVDGRLIDDAIVGREKHWTESFRAVDWDDDGLLDLIYSCAGTGRIYLLRNVGSVTEPVFDPPREMKCYGEPIAFTIHGPHPWAGDINGDGKPDLLGCVEWSVYPFFSYAALEMEEHPQYQLGQVRQRG